MPDLFHRVGKIESFLPRALGSERFSILKDIRRLKRLAKNPSEDSEQEKAVSELERKFKASVAKKRRRKDGVPEISINEKLPVAAKKDEISRAIQEHPVVIVSGATGSGKTTQIPKICLAAGRGIDGRIGCTQPRRIAAITVANRIAEELGEDLGKSVGYKIRFDEKGSRDGYIKVMTDGVLLAEAQSDPFLNEYDTLIIDEAHERSLNIDFVLGILKNLISRRRDLKLIVTSATIDTEKFSKAFDDAPIIEVSGRMYPVEVEYWPPEKFQEEEEITHVEMAVAAVERLQRKGPFGDILVFMPTEQDIRETCEAIEGRKFKGVDVFPLFARLSSGEQKRVFARTAGRKIIVATNVAETSITIPGIKYVVDTGLARMLRYSPRTRTTALPVEPVSRSSADQRTGRCGRVEKGVCIRLYSQEDYENRPLYTPPEISRSNLAEVILRMIALNLGDIDSFPFIDRPDNKSVADGFELLKELGAIGESDGKARKKGGGKYSLTQMGRFMAGIPLDPRISRILIEAGEEGVLDEILVVAAALSIRDPRERPLDKAEEADRKHAVFADSMSDFVSLLNIWNQYRLAWKKYGSSSGLKRFCKDHFLSFKRMREWRDIREQLKSILEDSGIQVGQGEREVENDSKKGAFGLLYSRIHRCMLSGFLSNIAQKKEQNIYRAAKNREAMIFPGSGIFNRAGEWIVAAEMVETSRLFARTCANVDDGWLEKAGGGLCRRVYLDPRWDAKRGEVVASEQVSLFGLVVVQGRPVSYGRINPSEAKDIFIRSALLGSEIKEKFGFLEHNRKLIGEVTELENRLRRRDILVGENEMRRFYESRLNGEVYDITALRKLVKRKGGDGFLKMERGDLLNYTPGSDILSNFPNNMVVGENKFGCLYCFEPGDEKDGVTIKIPAGAASSVIEAPLDWHVPGFLEEKITLLLKGLPKKYRKELVPLAETAKTIMEEMPKGEVSLRTALSRFVYERFKVDIPASVWPYDDLPDHLKLRISITDSKGATIRSGRDKSVLLGAYSEKKESEEVAATRRQWERDGIVEWDFGNLPETLTVNGKGGGRWLLYPALELQGDGSVSIRLFTDRQTAECKHREGVLALCKLRFSNELKFLRKNLSANSEIERYAAIAGGRKKFEDILYRSVTTELFAKNARSEKDFLEYGEQAAGKLGETGLKKKYVAVDVLKAIHEAREKIFAIESSGRKNAVVLEFCGHLRKSLSNLAPENFPELYDMERLSRLPRYIQAIGVRAQRGVVNLEKDIAKTKILEPFVKELETILANLGPEDSEEKRAEVEEFFWLLEEFKVSLFAQELKTVVPVSEKRLKQKADRIRRMV